MYTGRLSLLWKYKKGLCVDPSQTHRLPLTVTGFESGWLEVRDEDGEDATTHSGDFGQVGT